MIIDNRAVKWYLGGAVLGSQDLVKTRIKALTGLR